MKRKPPTYEVGKCLLNNNDHELEEIVDLCNELEEIEDNEFILEPKALEAHSRKLIKQYYKDVAEMRKCIIL